MPCLTFPVSRFYRYLISVPRESVNIPVKLQGGERWSPLLYSSIHQSCLYNQLLSYGYNILFTYKEEEAEQGIRKTQKGTNFSPGTLKSIRMACRQFEMFQAKSGRMYDFDDIDYGFRTMFLSYLYQDMKYNVNTAAKCINTLVTRLLRSGRGSSLCCRCGLVHQNGLLVDRDQFEMGFVHRIGYLVDELGKL